TPPAGGPSMTSTVITGISELWTLDPALDDPARPGGASAEQVRRAAALGIEDARIAWPGPAAAAPSADGAVAGGGRAVRPGWGASHTPRVCGGGRAAECEARMAGESCSAGGIGVTTDATRAASDERLRALVRGRIADAVAGGTTTLETKTGYGLTVAHETRAAQPLAALIAGGAVDAATCP